jgi:hypothetical protein
MNLLTALHVKVFPWSASVGVKVKVEYVMFPSDDTCKQTDKANIIITLRYIPSQRGLMYVGTSISKLQMDI